MWLILGWMVIIIVRLVNHVNSKNGAVSTSPCRTPGWPLTDGPFSVINRRTTLITGNIQTP